MSRRTELDPLPEPPGCARTTTGALLLALLAPLAVLVRSFSRWRRGSTPELRWCLEHGKGVLTERLWLHLDVPPPHGAQARRALGELVVRSAEALHHEGDSYHLVYRELGAAESTALPLGPRIQNLGERFALGLSRTAVEGRTLLWLVLPSSCPLATVLDPLRFDPEDPAQLEKVLGADELRWAVAVTHRQAAASTLYRLGYFLPEGASARVRRCGARLEQRLS